MRATVLLLGSLLAMPTTTSAAEPVPAQPVALVAERPDPVADDDVKQEESEDPEVVAMRKRLDRLEAENSLREAELKQQLAAVEEQRQRLEAELNLAKQRLETELAGMEAERAKLEKQAALAEQQQQAELRALKFTNEKATLAMQVKQAELMDQQTTLQVAQLKDQQEMSLLQLTAMRRQEGLAALQHQIAEVDSRLTLLAKGNEIQAKVEHETPRPAEPFVDGTLTVSDRRIALNGPIIEGTADHIERRIHFFNNRSAEQPIFLVIDDCPGGSIMEGYRILKAMEASRAPIHVVVKSFAASMAAVITTDADRSYALPNAIILHHQPLSMMFGNLAQQEEWVRVLKEWATRLHAKTVAKMGISLDDFYKRMYAESVSGDWEEFADQAVTLKWVDQLVERIREDGVREQPTDLAPTPWWYFFGRTGAKEGGTPSDTVRLPRPRPFDAYFLYNRDSRYIWE